MSSNSSKLFGTLLKLYRRKAGIRSHEGLAFLLSQNDYVLDPSTVRKYEKGTRTPNATTIIHIADCLGLSLLERDMLYHARVMDLIRKEYDAYNEAVKHYDAYHSR